MEQIATQYPESAPYLESLPDHLVEQIGSIAVKLTHEDMHPTQEVSTNGETGLAQELSNVITDPEYDSRELATDAGEAAQAGKQKIAEILLSSSQALHASYKQITQEDRASEPTEIETDEARDSREQAERSAIYNGAVEHVLASATTAKEQGDTTKAVSLLESIILLRYIEGGKSRKIFRETVRSGLTEELLQAARGTNKLFKNEDYASISHRVFGNGLLLEMASGKRINDDYEVTGDVQLPSRMLDEEEMIDAVAVMTSKNAWLTLDQGFEAFPYNSFLNDIKTRIRLDISPGQPYSPDYIYKFVEEIRGVEVLQAILKCTDPIVALNAAKKLSVPPWKVIALFGKAENWDDPKQINPELVNKMVDLKNAHPVQCAELIKSGTRLGESLITYDPAAISEGLDVLDEAGIKDPQVAVEMSKYPDTKEFVAGCIALYSACSELGVDSDELPQVTNKAGLTLTRVLQEAVDNTTGVAEFAQKLVCAAEIVDVYTKLYATVDYADSDKTYKPDLSRSPDLAEFPHIKDRMIAAGIPEDVAQDMFESWSTYNEFAKNCFTDEGFKLPNEMPDEATLEHIAQRQAEALITQLEKLELFVSSYGLETTKGIINTFGIYNFARHDSEELVGQYTAWQEGARVQAVVVEARNDWNSFTNKEVKFEEEVGEGVFYFEANSGYDAARIAVQIGKHERANGREPSVGHYIIHAHGNPQQMRLGVHGESISTAAYLESALNATRIGANEINDYTKHLGPNFEIILQSCSTAGESDEGMNIAETMSERHAAEVQASDVTINGLTIMNDGSVKFSTKDNDGKPVIYVS
jgi:hypothetical protein